jgi:hypothetical protein
LVFFAFHSIKAAALGGLVAAKNNLNTEERRKGRPNELEL